MDFLEKNLEALSAKNPALAGLVRGYAGERVNVEAARNGLPTFKFSGKLFHSSYDPAREAASLADEILSRRPDWMLLFGLGCGHIAKALLERGFRNILAYEPSMEILAGVLAGADISGLVPDVELFADMDLFMDRVRDLDGMDDLLCYSSNPYKAVFPACHADFLNRVDNAHTTSQVNIKTDIDSREAWIGNYFRNLRHLPEHAPIDALRGAFKGVPLIIAGAGPSLKKNAHLLREAKGKAVIIAAITAYKPLLGFGVAPDFVIAAEKVDLPEYFAYDVNDRETRLILGEVSHPGMFTRDVKEKFVFFNGHMALSREHAGFFGSSFFPSMGGSVTTVALDIGVMLGCSPIMFVGQDLCFGENETHAKGGVYVSQDVRYDRVKGEVVIEEDYVTLKEKARSNFKLLWLKGVDGRPVPSKYDWVTFHQWFENYMRTLRKDSPGVKVINSTEGGAYIEGMEHMPLRDALDMHLGGPIDLDERIERASSGRGADIPSLLASLVSMRNALKEMRRSAESILEEVRRIKRSVGDGSAAAEAVKRAGRIKKIEEDLFRSAEKSPFIWESLSAATHGLKAYLRESGADVRGPEVMKEIEAVSAAYRDVAEMCLRHIPTVNRAAEELRSRKSTGGRMMEATENKGDCRDGRRLSGR